MSSHTSVEHISVFTLLYPTHPPHILVQVVYGSAPHQLTLYVLASDVHQQREWVEALRECEGMGGAEGGVGRRMGRGQGEGGRRDGGMGGEGGCIQLGKVCYMYHPML